jgi:hypothetical protein
MHNWYKSGACVCSPRAASSLAAGSASPREGAPNVSKIVDLQIDAGRVSKHLVSLTIHDLLGALVQTPLVGRSCLLAEKVGFTRHIPVPRPTRAPSPAGAARACKSASMPICRTHASRGFSCPPSRPENRNAPCGAFLSSGGEGGIRTHDPLTGTPVFKTGAFNRSATSPF